MVKFDCIVAVAAFLPLLSYAAPSFTKAGEYMPAHAKLFAMDKVKRHIVAFDGEGRDLGAFPLHAKPHSMRKRNDTAGNCITLSSDDAKKMKGFSKMEDQAKKNWGKGKYSVVTNDADFPDAPAQVCSDDAGVVFQYDNDPSKSCHKTNTQANGTLQGGKIALDNQEGQTISGTTTVTQSVKVGVSRTFSASFKLPEIADVSSSTTFTAEFTNELSNAQTVAEDHRTITHIEQPVDSGSNCTVMLSTTNCQISGKGSLKMVSQGMVWFEYADKTQGHYKWGLDIASTLPDIEDRSETMEFKHLGESDTSGHFSADGCHGNATTSSAS